MGNSPRQPGDHPYWDEQRRLYVGGLLVHPLQQLVPLWLRELTRLGLTGGKDRSPSDAPQEPGAALVEASDGRKVWLKPDAYRDEEGYPRAEVRGRYSRTDGAIWAMLAVLEGGEGYTRKGNLEGTLREDYEAWRPPGVEDKPLNPANERLLECAEAAACERHPDLDTLSERDRREILVSFALRIHAVAKAVRELQEYGERGRVGHTGDPVRDVLAAELRDLHQLSWPEVGRQLGMSRTGRDEDKGGQQAVEVAAKRGRAMLDQALPEGWDEYVARCRRNLGL